MLRLMRLTLVLLFVGLTALIPVNASAVEPDEVLDDPVLEERARGISGHLRCLVCQNQSIDDSDAPLAKDLRVLVRERLVEGDSDTAVLDYVVDRYGEFVLLKPKIGMHTILLWGTPVLVFILGLAAFYLKYREPQEAEAVTPLTDGEQKEITKILGESDR